MRRSGAILFGADVPSGFQYRPDFIAVDDEARLVEQIGQIEFSRFEMRGVVARRRVAFFGRSYNNGRAATPPIPAWLLLLREQVGGWTSVDPLRFAMALINEYPPGAPIGWHRDAPQYDIVAGVSLLSPCRMRFRPYLSPDARTSPDRQRRDTTHEITLERRSAYLMTGASRSGFEHHIPATTVLRYSITFRTLRD